MLSYDAFQAPNRVGDIPMHWYDDLPHVGYSIDGKKVLKPARGDELDKFLQTVDDPSAWYATPFCRRSKFSYGHVQDFCVRQEYADG